MLLYERKPQRAKVTLWKKQEGHPAVELHDGMYRIWISTRKCWAVVREGFCIVESVHSCQHCSGELYGPLEPDDSKDKGAKGRCRFVCKNCALTVHHDQIKTGEIFILTKEELDKEWSKKNG